MHIDEGEDPVAGQKRDRGLQSGHVGVEDPGVELTGPVSEGEREILPATRALAVAQAEG